MKMLDRPDDSMARLPPVMVNKPPAPQASKAVLIPATRRVTVRDCLEAVSRETGFRTDFIAGQGRRAALIQCRFMVCWLASRLTSATLTMIAHHLDGRDHTTVGAAIRRFDEMRQADVKLKEMSDRLLKELRP